MCAASGKPRNLTVLFLVSVSIFGLLLSIVFAAFPPKLEDNFAFRNTVVGSAFAAVCVLGIVAVLYPDPCSRILNFEKRDGYESSSRRAHESGLRGHHPTCEGYSTHVLHIGDKRFCATCSGLSVGAIVVLVGVGLYFFGNMRIAENPLMLASMGVVGLILGLFYPSVTPKFDNGFTRFSAGILLAAGSFLILVSMEEAAANTSIDLFFVVLSVLWILTRMSISQWEHQRTCSNCSSASCAVKKEKMH
jgi:hypothetical protein